MISRVDYQGRRRSAIIEKVAVCGWRIRLCRPWGAIEFIDYAWARTLTQAQSIAREWCERKR